MIKILPLRDNELLKKLNEKENTAARLGYLMHDNDEIGGYILYNLNENEGIIQAISSPDDMVTDGLIRAVLAGLYDFGIDTAIFNIHLDNEMLQRLNFVNKGEYTIPSIEKILYSCKNCKK